MRRNEDKRIEKLNLDERYEGMMKNFYMDKNFGFIVIENFAKDIFVHFNDLEQSGLTKEVIKKSESIKLNFGLKEYGTRK